jgi:glycosyltransferase involved in cell wall biosynthesis
MTPFQKPEQYHVSTISTSTKVPSHQDIGIKTLTIIVPAYNEAATIHDLLERLCQVELLCNTIKEIIVVNDCSSDGTAAIVESFILNKPFAIRLINHQANQGKGAAIHTGIRHASGDFIMVQDADLEYDPREINLLLRPILDGHADVVYGSRFMGGNAHRILFFWHSIGNSVLTFISNMFTNLNLTDMETCYKLFRREHLQSLLLKEKRFGFEPEVTAKISRIPGIRIYEVGISYYGRTYAEGKKINWKDGFRAIYSVLKYNVWSN